MGAAFFCPAGTKVQAFQALGQSPTKGFTLPGGLTEIHLLLMGNVGIVNRPSEKRFAGRRAPRGGHFYQRETGGHS
jgi:hypothetical protein